MDEPEHDVPVSEAEYIARTNAWINAIADKLTAALPGEYRDAGLHFEWH